MTPEVQQLMAVDGGSEPGHGPKIRPVTIER